MPLWVRASIIYALGWTLSTLLQLAYWRARKVKIDQIEVFGAMLLGTVWYLHLPALAWIVARTPTIEDD